jgi:glutamate N-acetyltransferase/amino-acid N-acetyltransferase
VAANYFGVHGTPYGVYSGGISVLIPGFKFAAAAAGLKKTGDPDLALMAAESPATAAGVLTTNRVKAAPVLVSRARLRTGSAQAILANAGNANACTGPQGLATARETCRRTAELLKIPERLVLPASTGVIGQPLPGDKINQALPQLVAALSPDGLGEAARAIMTTDTRPKASLVQGKIGGKKFTLAGIAKGSGMIHPSFSWPAAPPAWNQSPGRARPCRPWARPSTRS